MKVLGIDTATWEASVALAEDDELRAERSARVTSSHAVSLPTLIAEVLAATGTRADELGLIAVSIGPGSFTGVRIGLSVAKGMALAAGLPLVGVPTLYTLARAAADAGLVCPVLDARKGELYAALYDLDADREILPPMSAPARSVAACLAVFPHITIVGEGAAILAQAVQSDALAHLRFDETVTPRASVVAALGRTSFAAHGAPPLAELDPLYVRLPEAEATRRAAGL